MAVLDWQVRDVSPKGAIGGYQTEWRAPFRDVTLVVLRSRSEFEYWIERAGSDAKWHHTTKIRSLLDAQTHIVSDAVVMLNQHTLSVEEADAVRLPLVVDLAEAYESAARRVAQCGLYGTELRLRLDAEAYRAEAAAIRVDVARRLQNARGGAR